MKYLVSLFDIPHPVVEDEIWGRYIMPEQTPVVWGISDWGKLRDVISKLIVSLIVWKEFFWEFVGCPCQECLKKINVESNNRKYNLPAQLNHSRNKLLKATPRLNYGSRIRPKWSYFYDMRNEITIIKSKALSTYLESLQKLFKNKSESIEGLKGEVFLAE